MPHPATLPLEQFLAECQARRQRRGGPGGQHRNKVASGVFLKHLPTGVEVSATERRSQADNQRMAIERLRIRLATEVRSPVVIPVVPSPLWQARCHGARLRVSPVHPDFAALLAEALDTLAGADWNIPVAAERLRCTRTQLVNLIRLSPEAFVELNRQRATLGLRPLKGE